MSRRPSIPAEELEERRKQAARYEEARRKAKIDDDIRAIRTAVELPQSERKKSCRRRASAPSPFCLIKTNQKKRDPLVEGRMNFTDHQVLTLVRAYPGLNIYQLTKKANEEMGMAGRCNWTTGKVRKGCAAADKGRQGQNEVCGQESQNMPAGLCNCLKSDNIICRGSEIIEARELSRSLRISAETLPGIWPEHHHSPIYGPAGPRRTI